MCVESFAERGRLGVAVARGLWTQEERTQGKTGNSAGGQEDKWVKGRLHEKPDSLRAGEEMTWVRYRQGTRRAGHRVWGPGSSEKAMSRDEPRLSVGPQSRDCDPISNEGKVRPGKSGWRGRKKHPSSSHSALRHGG